MPLAVMRPPVRLAIVFGLFVFGTIGVATVFNSAPDGVRLAQAAQATLLVIRQTHVIDPALDMNFATRAMPLPDVADPDQRKALFIAAMLPLVVSENARLEDLRARASRLPQNSPAYGALAHAYGLKPDVARNRLLSRIDIVPVSLTLAQGAIESAWGTSRFAREGNAYFGERTFDSRVPGLIPGDASQSDTSFKVIRFPSAQHSVRSYMHTLNTHPAYAALRRHRADLRAQGQRPTGLGLAPFLQGYAQIGEAYPRRISATIRVNGLSTYNALSLAR